MTVTHGRIGQQNALFIAHPFGKLLRSKLVEQLLGAVHHRTITKPRHNRLGRILRWLSTALGFWMTIDGNISHIGQKLGRAVLTLHMREKLRRRINEARRIVIRLKTRMIDDRFNEGQVCRDTANTEFAQSAVHTTDGFNRRRTRRRNLHQQWIIIARDDRARIGRAAIKTNAKARC